VQAQTQAQEPFRESELGLVLSRVLKRGQELVPFQELEPERYQAMVQRLRDATTQRV